MKLTSDIYRVIVGYKGKSKYDFWRDIKAGDIFEVSTVLENTMNHRGTNYAIGLKIRNLTNDQEFNSTMNSFLNYLSKIECEPVQNA